MSERVADVGKVESLIARRDGCRKGAAVRDMDSQPKRETFLTNFMRQSIEGCSCFASIVT